jgi:ribosomal protein L11 methyltransferase
MADQNWLEVSMTVDGEMAEAVAEVLARFAPSGVVVESTAVDTSPPDTPGHAVGPLRIFAYLPVDERLDETRQRLEEALWYLGRIRELPTPVFRPLGETDWSESWKHNYHPVTVGRKLVIVPAWLDKPPGERIPIRIDPGMAFGTGTHPTTQLCLELIEEFVELGESASLIDVGCGSGILSIAALKLGARGALGVDTDEDAIQSASENATLNGVQERFELAQGSLAEIKSGRFSIRQAPLVVANILAPVVIRLLDEGLAKILMPGGQLVLSGILEDQAGDIDAALKRNDLRIAARRQIDDWVALVAR